MFGLWKKPDHFNILMEYLVEHWNMRAIYASSFLSAYRKDVSATLENGFKRSQALGISPVAAMAMGEDPRAMAIVAQAYKGYLSDLRSGRHVGTEVEQAIWAILANRSDLIESVDPAFSKFIEENWEKEHPSLFEKVFSNN
jgi:hypothetical protein